MQESSAPEKPSCNLVKFNARASDLGTLTLAIFNLETIQLGGKPFEPVQFMLVYPKSQMG